MLRLCHGLTRYCSTSGTGPLLSFHSISSALSLLPATAGLSSAPWPPGGLRHLCDVHFRRRCIHLSQSAPCSASFIEPCMCSVQDQGIARTQSPTNKNYAPELPTFGAIDGVSPTEVQWKGLVHGEPPYGSRYPLCQVSMLWQRSAPHRVGLLPVKRREGRRPRSAGHLSREPGRLPARCSARSAS